VPGALATGLFALVAQAVMAGPASTAPDVEAARKLPLTQLAGHAIIMRFVGDSVPGYVRDALRDGRAAGVVLFHDNATSPATTKRLTRRIRRADPQALIAVDQEGGQIRILDWARPAQDQYMVSSRQEARGAGRAAARALRRYGVNVNLAPVADRSRPGSLMDARAFPGGTAKVARLVSTSIRAYAGSGVAPTVKHFPGLGAADANTDTARVTIRRPARVIGRSDLPPFQAAINAGAPAVMLSHAVYPALDRSAIASQSRAIVTDLLKDRMGFDGVAMTDSLEAYSVRSRMSMETAAVRSVRAGIDAVLTTGQGTHIRALRALSAEARRDPAFRTRLEDAAARVIALRRTLAQR
jgi:beta-N-acetylhexosaminidase